MSSSCRPSISLLRLSADHSKLTEACDDIEDNVAIKDHDDKPKRKKRCVGVFEKELQAEVKAGSQRQGTSQRRQVLEDELKAEIAPYKGARPKEDKVDVVRLAVEIV